MLENPCLFQSLTKKHSLFQLNMKVLGSEQTALTLISQLWGLFGKGGEVGLPERWSLLSVDSNQEVSD